MSQNTTDMQMMTMGLLDDGKQSSRAYLISTAVNGTALLLFVLFGVQHFVVHEQTRRADVISYSVTVAPPPPALNAPVIKTQPSKFFPPPSVKAPTFQAPVLAPTPRLSTIPIAPIAVAPKPPITNPLPTPTIAVVHPPTVKVGTFGAADVPAPAVSATPRTAAAPVVGSFGSPAPSTTATPRGNAVAGTGFGSNAVVKLPAGHPAVTAAGFTSNIGQAPAPGTVQTQVITTKPTVTFVPHPVYTADALAKRIEGDVAVKVILLANGQVQVVGVVHSLDPGLDKEALNVAQKIKFNPATNNHLPIDYPTVVHIQFQLS